MTTTESQLSTMRPGDFPSGFSNISGRIGAGNTPAPADTGRGRDRSNKEIDVTDITQSPPTRQTIALGYLARAVHHPWTTPEQLAYFVTLCAEHGCTTQEILDVCGDA